MFRFASSRRAAFHLLALSGLLLSAPALAQPDLSRPAPPTIADTGSAFYSFKTLHLDSADGERHYRIQVGVPNRPAPATGYPVLYLLDGNAALGGITETDLQAMDRAGPPVLVALGYETPLRFDVVARSYDYTPPVPGEQPTMADAARGRRGGGADQFLDLIETRVKPWVAQQAAIDPRRQALWGHSFGGVLVLHTLFTRPGSFQTYIAASPSLWWHDGALLAEEARFTGPPAGTKVRLLVTRGDSEGKGRADRPAPAGRAEAPADGPRLLTERLGRLPGLSARYQEFPGLDHGPALTASLPPALEAAVAP